MAKRWQTALADTPPCEPRSPAGSSSAVCQVVVPSRILVAALVRRDSASSRHKSTNAPSRTTHSPSTQTCRHPYPWHCRPGGSLVGTMDASVGRPNSTEMMSALLLGSRDPTRSLMPSTSAPPSVAIRSRWEAGKRWDPDATSDQGRRRSSFPGTGPCCCSRPRSQYPGRPVHPLAQVRLLAPLVPLSWRCWSGSEQSWVWLMASSSTSPGWR